MFDELLDGARRAYGLRDDNGPLTAEWPMGLVRRAYLEAGRRLATSGRLQQASHVFELDAADLAAVLRGAAQPTDGRLRRASGPPGMGGATGRPGAARPADGASPISPRSRPGCAA